MYRTLFVPALADRSLSASLLAAEPIARTLKSHISCLFVAEPIAPSPGMELGWSDELVTSAEDAMAELSENLGQAFMSFCADHNIDVVDQDYLAPAPRMSASWSSTRGETDERAASFARQADLIVMARPENPSRFGCRFEEALVARSGRPVLITPATPPLAMPGHPIVAWNGSREAARAVAMAMPMIQHAGAVTVVSVGDLPRDVPSAEDLSVCLHRQGVKATFRQVERQAEGVLATLEKAVTEFRGDLLVMGAYSHAQWREVVLGGVTRGILKGGNVPVLLAH